MSLNEETAKKVIRQVEFYFSDSNLPRDHFLKKTINESDDGMVNLALICSFSRMRGHLGLGDVKAEDVSEDTVKNVAETLRASSFLKVSEDGKKVGRITELTKPDEVIKQLDDRTIAASPLEYDVKLEDVESFFTQYAMVNSVRLPRHVSDNRLFCGTALVEFSSEEDASSILKQTLSYSGVALELKPKKDFDTQRAKQEEEESKKNRFQKGSNRRDKANAEPEYPKGLIVAFKLKKITTENSSEYNGNNVAEGNSGDTKEAAPENAGEGGEEEADKTSEPEAEEPKDVEQTPDNDENEDEQSGEDKKSIDSYKGNKDIVMREDLKRIFQKFGTVKFIDFKMGSESGYIRFEDDAAATKARAAAVLTDEGGLIVKNFIATLDPVTGEAEKEYWSLLRSNQEKHHNNFKGNNRGRGGKHHNKGGRQFGGKHSRSRGNDSANRPNKVQKTA